MPPAYASPEVTSKSLTEAFKPTTDAQRMAIGAASALVPSVIKGEPAVLSSRMGADTFASTVQPTIDGANATVEAARAKKAADASAAAAALVAKGEPIPQDVLDELNASRTPEEKASAARLASWDKQRADAEATNESLTLAAKATAAAQISTLSGQWQERKQLLERANSAEVATWNQQFLRTGQAEYSPGMTGTFITGKEQAGQAKVKALDDEYNAKIAAVNAALEKGNFERAAALTKDLTAIEDKALTAMQETAKAAAETNKKMKEALATSSREMAISGIVAQGITDPAEIQDYLNNTDAGEQVGDITLAEIEKVLKVVNPDPKLSGLSADYRTFKELQKIEDPAVKGLDYFGFLKAVHLANTAKPVPTTTTEPAQTFDEYLAEREQDIGANIAPGSDLYKQIRADYEAMKPTLISLANISTTDKKALDLAGLGGADIETKAFFLASPSKFRQHVQQQAAAGEGVSTLDEMMTEYDTFVASASDGSSGAVFKSDQEMMDWLNKP